MRPIYYDTETTGIRAEEDRIIELAAYCPETNTTFSQLIHPGRPIPAAATAVHQITDEMVAKAPPFAEVAQEFVAFCHGDVALIAHNNDGFDRHFIEKEFDRAGLSLPDWEYVDTLKWARRYRPDLPRHSLQFLRETYGIPANQAHRALDDVKVLHAVFSQMIDDLSIDTVIDLLSSSHRVTRMPFGKHRGIPLSEIPKSYLKWLSNSGALDKPDNTDLKQALVELELV